MTSVATLPMSDAAPMATDSLAVVDPAVAAWLDRFGREPDAALDDLLLGKAWLAK